MSRYNKQKTQPAGHHVNRWEEIHELLAIAKGQLLGYGNLARVGNSVLQLNTGGTCSDIKIAIAGDVKQMVDDITEFDDSLNNISVSIQEFTGVVRGSRLPQYLDLYGQVLMSQNDMQTVLVDIAERLTNNINVVTTAAEGVEN